VLLLTVEKLRNGDWPREAIDEMFFMPEDLPLSGLINAVSFTARNQKIDRIVALDEFDWKTSRRCVNIAHSRHGPHHRTLFPRQLAMRAKAREEGVLVPEFVHVSTTRNSASSWRAFPLLGY